jgi:ABC-type transport system involved in multi-copper enzyme maturation permease subunit
MNAAIAPSAPAPGSRGAEGSPVTVAAQMFGADFLKLRKKRGILIWALVLAVVPVVLFFVIGAILHATTPSENGPAGGLHNFHIGMRLLGGLFFGPLAAILIGVEAGTGDAAAGVFRDLVVTGRSRLALFASRVPAALAVCWLVIVPAYLLVLLGTFAFASNLPTPDGALIFNSLGYLLLATGALCAVAVGFASLTTSRPAAIIALIAWQVIASPLLASISVLGSERNAILYQALSHFSPVALGDRAAGVTMSGGTAAVVIAGWLVLFLGLGAWRTSKMDA